MLVFSRKRNQKAFITAPNGDSIEIVVLEIRGDKVRLGISAPKSYGVDREEIKRDKDAAKVSAASIQSQAN